MFDQNQLAKEEGRDTLNLTSVLIGNGIVDISKYVQQPPYTLASNMFANRTWRGRHEVECTTASFEVPFQKISTCVRQKTAVSRPSCPISWHI